MTNIIKKLLIVTVLLTACTPIDTGKPYTTNLKHDRVILFWKTHDDVHDVCGALSSRKTPRIITTYHGCAQWDENLVGGLTYIRCMIHTGKETSHEIVGHEVRHCFEAHFH